MTTSTSDVPELPTQANRHFMGAVVNLAERQEVVLADDVFSQSGVKLLAKGARVSPATYEKVVNHKLSRPIESSLVSVEPPSPNALMRMGEDAMETFPLLARLCDWSQGRVTPLGMLGKVNLSPVAGTLLNVHFARNEAAQDAPRHAVMTALVAMSLANATAYNNPGLMGAMCVGGLFHDVGEMYVDPALLQSGRSLTATEWMSYSFHPVIGAALAREICGFDTPTQRAILEHHESADGFGYPRSLRGTALSQGGQLMALAEVLAALIVRPSAEDRIAIALKIMPSEHDAALLSVVHELLRESRGSSSAPSEALAEEVDGQAHALFIRIAGILGVHDALMQQSHLSRPCREIMDVAFGRFVEVQRAFASTGIANLSELGSCLSAAELQESRFEAQCVLHEIAWRMMKLSRELTLKAGKCKGDDAAALMTLANAMAGAEEGALVGCEAEMF